MPSERKRQTFSHRLPRFNHTLYRPYWWKACYLALCNCQHIRAISISTLDKLTNTSFVQHIIFEYGTLCIYNLPQSRAFWMLFCNLLIEFHVLILKMYIKHFVTLLTKLQLTCMGMWSLMLTGMPYRGPFSDLRESVCAHTW